MDFESYLLGHLAAIKEAHQATTPVVPPPAPAPSLVDRWRQEQEQQQAYDRHFLDTLEEQAGLKPVVASPEPAAPPSTLSRSAADFTRQFARHAEAIADGRTEVVP